TSGPRPTRSNDRPAGAGAAMVPRRSPGFDCRPSQHGDKGEPPPCQSLPRCPREAAMTPLVRTLAAVAASVTLATGALAQSAAQNASEVQIEHHVAKIDGTRFHYVTAGTGEAVVLLPGWPESWIAWRKVVPLLVSAGRRVVVLDPRGFGESDKPAGGYDLDTAARDLHGFLEMTKLASAGGVDIVAHDVGTWIAHAHAANFPAAVRRL